LDCIFPIFFIYQNNLNQNNSYKKTGGGYPIRLIPWGIIPYERSVRKGLFMTSYRQRPESSCRNQLENRLAG